MNSILQCGTNRDSLLLATLRFLYHPGQKSNLNNFITLDSLNAQGQSCIHFLFPTLSDKLLSYFLQVSLGLSSHNHLSTKVIYPKSYQNSNESGTFSGFGQIGPSLVILLKYPTFEGGFS